MHSSLERWEPFSLLLYSSHGLLGARIFSQKDQRSALALHPARKRTDNMTVGQRQGELSHHKRLPKIGAAHF